MSMRKQTKADDGAAGRAAGVRSSVAVRRAPKAPRPAQALDEVDAALDRVKARSAELTVLIDGLLERLA